MIIKTRYRDIPLEEIGHSLLYPAEWASKRGKPIEIIIDNGPIDPATIRSRNPACDGIRWLTTHRNIRGRNVMACEHIAELGD
jgi:hypothetical protein